MEPHLYLLLQSRESGNGLIIIPAGHVKLKQLAGACETLRDHCAANDDTLPHDHPSFHNYGLTGASQLLEFHMPRRNDDEAVSRLSTLQKQIQMRLHGQRQMLRCTTTDDNTMLNYYSYASPTKLRVVCMPILQDAQTQTSHHHL
jgi:hypothetical protein